MAKQKKLEGRFFFKETDNGNLIGEYSNNYGIEISTESSDLIAGCDNDSFLGTYHSTWLEDEGPEFAELTISKIKRTKLFTLEWCKINDDKSHKILIFVGGAMLCDGILIGNYRQPTKDEIEAHHQAHPQPII